MRTAGSLLLVLVVYLMVMSGGDEPVVTQQDQPTVTTPSIDLAQVPQPEADRIQQQPITTQTPVTQRPDTGGAVDPFAETTRPDVTTNTMASAWEATLNSGQFPPPLRREVSVATGNNTAGSSDAASTDLMSTGASSSGPVQTIAPELLRTVTDNRTAPSTRPSGPGTHVVQRGETLSSISIAVYGNAHYYPHIQRANPTINPSNLKVGSTLIIPDPSTVIPPNTQSATSAADSANVAVPRAVPSTTVMAPVKRVASPASCVSATATAARPGAVKVRAGAPDAASESVSVMGCAPMPTGTPSTAPSTTRAPAGAVRSETPASDGVGALSLSPRSSHATA